MADITGTKLFGTGDVLTSADTNRYLMRGVKVFADAAARDAAYGGAGEPDLEEGEVVYLADTDVIFVYNGSSWQSVSPLILQVVSTTKTDTFTTSSSTYVDITGLSVTITPASVLSKILVIMDAQGNAGANTTTLLSAIQVVRDSTAISVGNADGSRWQASASFSQPQSYSRNEQLLYTVTAGVHILDQPNTTSPVVYKAQARVNGSFLAINRSVTDSNSGGYVRTASTITAIEVVG